MIRRQGMYKVFRKAVLGVILCFALLLSAGVLLTACKPAEEQKEQQYTVVYDTQGGGNVKNGVYTPGVNFNLPTPSIGSDPEMYGYSFIGWFYDAECTQPVDRKNIDTSKAVDGVLTFYAGWSNIHKIYFDTKTDQIIEPAEYEYGASVSVSSLPVPEARVVGSTVCEFICWVQANTDEQITEDFRMDAVDMYFYAFYDTGVNSSYDLTEDGYHAKSFGANTELTSVGAFEDNTVFSVDMTFPADPADYADDAGPVFGFSEYIESSNSFGNGSTGYMYLFVSAAANAAYNTNKGALDIWGTWTDEKGVEQGPGRLYYMSMDTDLAGTPYQQKFSDYLSSGEAETFTYTIRRSGNKYYIGVDGTEYCCIELGGARKPSSATENLAGTISENLTGTRVGLRSKSTNVYYSNIAITPVEEVSITYDAVNGRIGEEQIVNKTYAYGGTIGTLPVPVYDGYEFTGWYYTDYATGEVVKLTADKALDSSIWKLTVTARYRKEGAEPFTVVFDTGVDGYTVPSVEGWFEGNPLEAPKLSKTFWTFSEEWFYDAECTRAVNLNDVDPTQAESVEEQTLTLYAKAEEHAFTNDAWSLTQDKWAGEGSTLVNGYELSVGQTLEIDITLPAYSTAQSSATGILFGAASESKFYGLYMVANLANSDSETHGAIQLYKDGTFVSGCSVRRSAPPLAGSSYQHAYDAYMTSGEPLTVTFGVIVTEDTFYCMVNGTVVFTRSSTLEGTFVGFKSGAGADVQFSNVRITENATTVTLEPGDGTLPEGTQNPFKVNTGDAIGTLPVPHLDGYQFVAWMYNGEAITESRTFLATERNVTLTAQWAEVGAQVTVTFDAGEGTVSETTRTLAAGSAIGTLPVAERGGYRFLGWYDEDTVVTEETIFVSDATLTAKWEDASGWDGTSVSTAYAGGIGTQEDPYLIASGADLKFFANNVTGGQSYKEVYFRLTNDISLNGHVWASIGTETNIFGGTLDGAGFTISGLTNQLFDRLSGATIKNVKLEVTIENTVEAQVGAFATVTQDSIVTIIGCEVRGTIASSKSQVGGFFGWVNSPLTMTNCVNYADITCTVASGNAFTGGIIGSHNSGILLLTGCKNYGTIMVANGAMVGGIAGIVRVTQATGSLITECYNFGNVTAKSQVGGIVGVLRLAATNCYNSTSAIVKGGAEASAIAGQVNNGGSYKNCGTCDENGENKTALPDKSS